MKIALVDPSFYHQGKLMKFKRVGYFPLTLPRLAAYFPKNCEINLYYDKVQSVPVEKKFDLVFFTTMGSNIVRAFELSAAFQKNGAKTVVGGYSVPGYIELCKQNFDSVVLGDGEEVIPRIIEDFLLNRLEKFYENRVPSISSLPMPRFDLVPSEVPGNVIPVEASRGCPNKCFFCAISNLYRRVYRQRDVDEVFRELNEAVRVFGRRRLYYFTDPNFTTDINYAGKILTKMVGMNISWLASADVKCLEDDEFLKLAKKSGCFNLQIGFETLSEKELNQFDKGFAAKYDYGKLIRKAHSFGVPISALLMVGFDSDTPSTFLRLKHFLEINKVPLAVTHPLGPIPGTPLHDKWKTEGRLLSTEPEKFDGLQICFKPKNFTPDELSENYWRFNERLFSTASIFRRFLSPHVFRNFRAFFILFLTNFFARQVVSKRLPPGMYE
ncbi:MAG: B12-binding domain-containing radical SAM protein [Candidatus Riflebacteria bacterium]|nr:B12-binding domain-containing radical SAM protein [Candidatus Riflebacteria bacterium]